ncbi:hypothetical protein F5Y07DRAFT_385679 [Xylaria sp. FL0933]|nr:hypothetical protein F5Y07DRAFT_385679 [Xylaria sp. FL0933]
MSSTGSTEPFAMRIPSPDPDLTGQALAKAVPDDPTRTGSIYADQFLAHKCPSHFDELQRRQFFCILDLRRLKYAADEIFTKKDWKLNILNFAKEYEKSRGLIMLRYGLYEFKNVKPSSEVIKKWRAAHGLAPETGDEAVSSPNRSRADAAGSTKRKAEEELTPRGNASTTSAASQNKRVNLAQETDNPSLSKPAPFKTPKRKADESEEVDENKPSKQLKPTPSAAASLFESIINKPRNGGPSPSKQTSQPSSLFDISNKSLFPDATKANGVGSPAGSVLVGQNAESKPNNNTGNIFSYLSGSSTNSSEDENDNADDDESDSGAEPDSEEQEASAAVSTGTSTPPVQNGSLSNAGQKTSQTSNIFGGLSKSADEAPKGGLFGRVQMGANGQPVRANPLPDEGQEGPLDQVSTPEQQQTKTPAKRPGDYTFGFSFGQQPSSTPKAPVPSQNGSIFGSSTKTNGALNFSFTQASPGQNSQAPKSSALMNSSGHLQASGDGSTRATPNEDGEEAPHEQISLTEGGPGEEDETLLHEVRAKAIKYIPVQKGDEDQEKEKSPWSTRGVGPLRVLKNKATGAVRILLRAEPRGHVALNKTILPDVDYTPKLKTLHFVTADDNGSGLETWVLQVKSAALATELAGVLEANKIANKK